MNVKTLHYGIRAMFLTGCVAASLVSISLAVQPVAKVVVRPPRAGATGQAYRDAVDNLRVADHFRRLGDEELYNRLEAKPLPISAAERARIEAHYQAAESHLQAALDLIEE